MRDITVVKITLTVFVLFMIISCSTEPDETDYTVTFNANGASGTPPAPMKAYENTNYLVHLPGQGNLTYPSKIFYGWNIKADGTGIIYFPYVSEYTIMPQITENTIMYAQWVDQPFPPIQNLKLARSASADILSWDPVEGDFNLEDTDTINYLYDSKKFTTYVILRRATNAGMWTTNNFEPYGFSSKPNYNVTGRVDLSVGGTFEYIVALGVVTVKNFGSNFDVVLGSHSDVIHNIVSTSFIGGGNFMPAPTLFEVVVNLATSVTLSWRRATNLNSNPCLGFYVYYATDGNNLIQENFFIPYNENADYDLAFRHTYTKTVNPSTTYYFSVAAVYNDDRGQLATPIKVTTPDPPVIVTGVTATAYSSTCINLS